jgi:hypothetical protein
MVYRYVRDNGHGHTIQVNPMVKGLFLCLALDPMIFVTGTTTLEWWSLYLDIISGLGHPRSDSIGLLMMYNM